ncbi:MAG: hypothetical protein ACSHX3_01945 [Litorimonas sp.]
MSKAAKLALIPPFLLGLYMTVLAIFMPDQLTNMLGGIAGTGPVGEASVRSDFVAYFGTFFIGVAAALLLGKRSWLWAPIALFGITGIFRIIYAISNGFAEGAFQPIAIEVVMCALMIFAMRSKPA